MAISTKQPPAYLKELMRHFDDLRDGTHGDGTVSRVDKEQLFRSAVTLLDPYAREALAEINDVLLLGSGVITATGIVSSDDGGIEAAWTLGWPEQELARIQPVTLLAFFGRGFHHPHLRGGTVGIWPLNIFNGNDAEAELPTLRAIAAAELHNLVFQRDWRIVPATVRGAG